MASSEPIYETFSAHDWLESTTQLVAALHNIILIGYHVYHIRADLNQQKAMRFSTVKIISIVAIFVPIIYNLMAGINPWIRWLRSSSRICDIWMEICFFFWGVSKTLMYQVFMERLFTVFAGSHLEFRKKHKVAIRVIFVMCAIVLCGIANLLSGSEFDGITGRCEWDPVKWTYILAAAAIVIVEVGISVTFSRRLVQLNALKQSLSDNNRESIGSITQSTDARDSFKNADENSMSWLMLQKSAVCTFITLLSTPWSLFMGFFFELTGLWAAIDMVICSWMVMLIFSTHQWIYLQFCGRLEVLLWTPCLYFYTCYCCTKLDPTENSMVGALERGQKRQSDDPEVATPLSSDPENAEINGNGNDTDRAGSELERSDLERSELDRAELDRAGSIEIVMRESKEKVNADDEQWWE